MCVIDVKGAEEQAREGFNKIDFRMQDHRAIFVKLNSKQTIRGYSLKDCVAVWHVQSQFVSLRLFNAMRAAGSAFNGRYYHNNCVPTAEQITPPTRPSQSSSFRSHFACHHFSLLTWIGAPPDHGSNISGEPLSDVHRLDAMDVENTFSPIILLRHSAVGSHRIVIHSNYCEILCCMVRI